MRKFLAMGLIFFLLSGSVAMAIPAGQIYDVIDRFYIEEVDPALLRQVSVESLGTFLGDSYFKYFTPEQFKEYVDGYTGFYGGIGTQITKVEDKVVIGGVYPDSPAEKAGLRVGDIILRVDGKSVNDLSLSDVALLLRGLPHTSVRVVVSRGTQTWEVVLIRAIIQSPTVSSYALGDVAVIEIQSFNNLTPKLFEDAVAKIHELKPRGVIIDLRNNPGGSITSVLDAIQAIVPVGPVFSMNTRKDGEITFSSFSSPREIKNLVVLVNRNTASAAEIFAACIRDRGLGILIGETTYGKASVQSVFRLKDNSGLRLTTARYFPPSGQYIDQIGVNPDIYVAGKQQQLLRAVEHIRLKNTTMVFTIDKNFLWFNGRNYSADVNTFLQDGRTYVPVRFLAEYMGYDVKWDGENSHVLVEGKKDGRAFNLIIPVGEEYMVYNSVLLELFGKSTIINGRTMVPVRTVAEALGGRVWWDNINKEAIVDWN